MHIIAGDLQISDYLIHYYRPVCYFLVWLLPFQYASNVQGSYRRYNKYKIAKRHKNKKKKVEEKKKKNMALALDTHDFTRQK